MTVYLKIHCISTISNTCKFTSKCMKIVKQIPITFHMHTYILNTLLIKEGLLLEKGIFPICCFKKKIFLSTTPTIKHKQFVSLIFFFPNLITTQVT